jgi:hypothetical protein
MIIKPVYVTFEQARLLKEKDFGMPYMRMGFVTKFYNSNQTLLALGRTGKAKELIPAPEQWQVLEWLRLKHDIHIWVRPYKDHGDDVNDPLQFRLNVHYKGVTTIKERNDFHEACSDAIDYALLTLL